MRKILSVSAAVVVLGLMAATTASAAQYEVKMLNKGAEGMMVFEPSMLRIQAGDTVHFVPTDKGHNAMSIAGMLPAGAAAFEGKMGKEVAVTFNEPGIYGFECKPHYNMGMVGMVVVGDPVNLDDARAVAHKGKAKQRFEKLFQDLAK